MSRSFIKVFCLFVVSFVVAACASNTKEDESTKKEIALSIIKPDLVGDNNIGEVISLYEKNGLRVAGMKLVRLSDQKASEFLTVMKGKPTYSEIADSITSGPVLLVVLEGDNAVNKNIQIVGGEQGTIQTKHKTTSLDEQKKAVYWSENPSVAKMDVAFFFEPEEVNGRY